ncbi:MAG: Rpn family recombination-promoting nuclease/putative transposase, partial [Prevotellaceae bacterium]|nr:Rpn family recombination-promoting nuclease/putative transposase [Prevotellaceae bacterium]
QPVYALSFVNEIFEPSLPLEYYHHYRIVNIQHTEKQIKGLEFVFIELPKFKPCNLGERKLHELWLRFLTEIQENTEVIPSSLLSTEEMREAVHYLEQGAYTKAELDAYDKYWDAVMVEKALRSDSILKGHAEGRAEGRAEGEAERFALKAALEKEKSDFEMALEKEKLERAALKAKIDELERQILKDK